MTLFLKEHAYTENSYRTWCAFCGNSYDQSGAGVAFYDGEEAQIETMVGEVCPDCIAAGPQGAAQRIREHACRVYDALGDEDRWADRSDMLDDWAEAVVQMTEWVDVQDWNE